MVQKLKGRVAVGKLEAGDEQLELPDGLLLRGGDILSANGDVIRKLNTSRGLGEGDADHTLAVSADPSTSDIDGTVLIYTAPLTANRTVTLSTAGAVLGMRYRIVRASTATGAFSLDVGPGVKTLATGEWVDVAFNGSAWIAIGFGSGV